MSSYHPGPTDQALVFRTAATVHLSRQQDVPRGPVCEPRRECYLSPTVGGRSTDTPHLPELFAVPHDDGRVRYHQRAGEPTAPGARPDDHPYRENCPSSRSAPAPPAPAPLQSQFPAIFAGRLGDFNGDGLIDAAYNETNQQIKPGYYDPLYGIFYPDEIKAQSSTR